MPDSPLTVRIYLGRDRFLFVTADDQDEMEVAYNKAVAEGKKEARFQKHLIPLETARQAVENMKFTFKNTANRDSPVGYLTTK